MSLHFRQLVLVLMLFLSFVGYGRSEPIPTATVALTSATAIPPTATRMATATPTTALTTTAPLVVEEIRFQSGHVEPVGDLQLPTTEGKHPAIIMVYGDGGIDRYNSGKYRPIMERFLRAGYAVFSWDKPGTGESSGRFVEGAWIIADRASISTVLKRDCLTFSRKMST